MTKFRWERRADLVLWLALLLTGLKASATAAASYEVGVGFGPLLPSRIAGVREILNGWALRGAVHTAKGVFECEVFNGRGEGDAYTSAMFDYRIDFGDEAATIPIHFLVGLHLDGIQPADQGLRTAGGWHYGGGLSLPVVGDFRFRSDFKHRFSPGNSLIVLVGFSQGF